VFGSLMSRGYGTADASKVRALLDLISAGSLSHGGLLPLLAHQLGGAGAVARCDNTDSHGGEMGMEDVSPRTLVREHSSEYRGQTDTITAEERAEWLIEYVIRHQGEALTELLRKAVEQFVAAEASAYERGRKDAL